MARISREASAISCRQRPGRWRAGVVNGKYLVTLPMNRLERPRQNAVLRSVGPLRRPFRTRLGALSVRDIERDRQVCLELREVRAIPGGLV